MSSKNNNSFKIKRWAVLAVLATLWIGSICMAGDVNSPSENGSALEFFNDPNLSFYDKDTVPTGQILWRMVVAVVLIVVLGVGAGYAARKFGHRVGNAKGREIEIVESMSVGTGKNLHLLRVGARKLLIGTTRDNIVRLADLSDMIEDFSEQINEDV